MRCSGIDKRLSEIGLALEKVRRVGVETKDLVAGDATVIDLLVEVLRQVVKTEDIVAGGARGIKLVAVQRQLVETKELVAGGAAGIDLLEDIKRVGVEMKNHMAGGATGIDALEEMRRLIVETKDLVEDGVQGIDLLVAMGLDLRAEPIDAPRRACVLPSWHFALEQGLSDEEKQPDAWRKRLDEWRQGGCRGKKYFFTKKTRLFLVCARTDRLVPCGHEGHGYGYSIECARKWLRAAVGLTTLTINVVCATLGGIAIPSLPGNIVGTLAEQVINKASTT